MFNAFIASNKSIALRSSLLAFYGLLWLSLAFIGHPAYAARIHPRAGTTSAAFLKLNPSPRAWAMGGAAAALSDDVYASAWNPAGLLQLKKAETAFMHNEHFQNLNQEYIGFAAPLNNYSAGGLSAQGLFVPKDLERRSGEGEDDPTSHLTLPEGKFGANDLSLDAAWAHRLPWHISGGVVVKWIRQSIDAQRASGAAMDAGLLWRAPEGPFSAGAVVQHLGQKIRFNNKAYPLPLNFKAGVAGRFFEDCLLIAGDINKPRDNYLTTSLGAEYRFVRLLFLRAGYRARAGGNELGAASGWSAGLGFLLKAVQLDYAFTPSGDLGQSHRIGLLVRFSLPKRVRVTPVDIETQGGSPGAAAPLPRHSLTVAFKLLRISGPRVLHSLTASAGPASDVERLTFRTDNPFPDEVPLALEENPAPDGIPEDIIPYKTFTLLENNMPVLGNMGVTFSVPTAWLEERGLLAEHVVLYAWDGHFWQPQATRQSARSAGRETFLADVAGGSRWLIGVTP